MVNYSIWKQRFRTDKSLRKNYPRKFGVMLILRGIVAFVVVYTCPAKAFSDS